MPQECRRCYFVAAVAALFRGEEEVHEVKLWILVCGEEKKNHSGATAAEKPFCGYLETENVVSGRRRESSTQQIPAGESEHRREGLKRGRLCERTKRRKKYQAEQARERERERERGEQSEDWV
jgi:hypothetical protein